MCAVKRCKALAEQAVFRRAVVPLISLILIKRRSACSSAHIQFILVICWITVGATPVLVVIPVGVAGTARPHLVVGHYLQVDEQRAVAGVSVAVFSEGQTECIVIALAHVEVLSEVDAQTVLVFFSHPAVLGRVNGIELDNLSDDGQRACPYLLVTNCYHLCHLRGDSLVPFRVIGRG